MTSPPPPRLSPLWPEVSGPYVTVSTLLAVELLWAMVPGLPGPGPLLLVAVAYAGLSGSLRSGLGSAALAAGYLMWLGASAGAAAPLAWVMDTLLMVAALLGMALMVGTLKARAERAFQLQAEHERLQRLDALKTQFINNAAHELRTPLTPIKVQMHLLRTEGWDAMSERQRKAFAMMDRNIDRLNALVQDLLEVARLQGGQIPMERAHVDLAQLVEESVESFGEAAAGAGVHLELRALPSGLVVHADPRRVIQVMFNLLGNALKFTPRGGRVEVALGARGGEAVVSVEDTGRGLRPADLARLFAPFSQVHHPDEVRQPGSGLGLYICKGIVEQHGGRVWAESDGPGQGARFAFSLPLAAAPRGAAPPAQAGANR